MKYRTLDQLISSVAVDFYKNQLEGTINPQELIKIVKKVNYDLGLRIMMTKEEVLEVEKGKVKLPDNFYVLNYALVCDEIGTYQQMPQGTNIQDIKVFPKYQETNAVIDLCTPSSINCNTIVQGCTCVGQCTCTPCTNEGFINICETPIVSTNVINTNSTTSVIVNTSQCSWNIPIKWPADFSVGLTIAINGIPYTVPIPHNTIGLIIIGLNNLNLGTFSYVLSGDGNYYIITGIGTNEYGKMVFLSNSQGQQAEPTCVILSSITNNTVINTTNTTVDTVNNCVAMSPDLCSKPRVTINCKGEAWEVVQVVNPGIVNYFTRLTPLRLKQNAESIDCDCPNLYMQSTMQGWIQNGFLFTNFDCGKVYINYQGTLEDDDGNLLVPDHDGLNEYYEYSLKKRILENLMMNDEPVGQKLQYVIAELKTARLYAKTIVNTPNFAEMKQLWIMNRRAQYGKYYNMFKSYQWYQWDRNPNMDMLQNPSR